METTSYGTSTLEHLLKSVGDVRKEMIGDKMSVHQVVEMSETGMRSRRLPFVLAFNNLTYNVKVARKIAVTYPVSGVDTATPSPGPSVGENQFTRTKVLLNDISGEARDGEILAVLGANALGKSTLIDAIANRIAKGSLKGTVTLNGEKLES
ncbi:hypothetical protein U1Q18_010640 [Sarracenia purpurea var. burkii]